MGNWKIYIKIVVNYILAALAVLFIFLILPRILAFFMPFVVGWIIAMIANPMVKFLEKKVKLLRKHSSAIIIVVVIALTAGAIYMFFSIVARQISSLMKDLPAILRQMGSELSALSDRISRFTGSMPESIQKMMDKAISGIGEKITNFTGEDGFISFSFAGGFLKGVAEGFLLVIVSIISAYFFIVKKEELTAGFNKLIPPSASEGWRIIFYNFRVAVGGYFKAQFKIMLLLIVVMFAGFEILNVGYSFLLALGIAFLDFLPVFGTGAVLWPWAIVDLVMGNYMRAIGLVVIYLICQILKQILQPKMVADSIGISPLATLLFMYTGYQLYGVLGMILGIPIGMVIVNLYRVGMFDLLIKGFKILVHDINEFRKF